MINFSYFIAGYLVIFGLPGAYIMRLVLLKKRVDREHAELTDRH